MAKKMSNAPVYYTIAQAQFNPVAAMDRYIEEVQNDLRLKGYTLFDKQKVAQLHFDISSTPPSTADVRELPMWRFTKPDQSSGFILSQSSLVYHTTHYQTHNQFFNELLLGLQNIHAIVQFEHLSRLGLRYLNAVLPSRGETVDQYLVDELHGLKFDASRNYSLSESVFDTSSEQSRLKQTLVIRVHSRNGFLGYPPDMGPCDLIPLERLTTNSPILHGIIDIDHFVEGQMLLDFKQIKTQLTRLHTVIKKAFNAVITERARKTWA